MLTRTWRFILPVMVVAALLWGLGATNATKDCNEAGMQQPYWNLIRSFAGYCTIVFNSVSRQRPRYHCYYIGTEAHSHVLPLAFAQFTAFEFDTPAGQTFAGNLWTNAWLFQSSYAVYVGVQS